MPQQNAAARFVELIDELRSGCDAGRTTLRLRSDAEFFPVVAESRAEGVGSIASVSADLASAPTFRYLADRLELLVQDDCLTSDVPTPPEVMQLYGVKAQMLAPVVIDGELHGTISVHETRSARHWSDDEISSIVAAADEVRRILQLSRKSQ